MKRIIERRDFLSHLLTNSHPDFTVDNNNVAHLPACELKSLLVAISAECTRKRSVSSLGSFKDAPEEEVVYEQPQERARRRTISNNHHSILRFLERILESKNNDRGAVNNDQYAQFLQNEMQSYFGTNDALFRAEEDILFLVFELAYDAIRSVTCIDNNDKSFSDTIHQRDIVDTSLRIIDRVIHVDKQERITHHRLQSIMKRNSLSKQGTFTNKRQKYAHLLQTNVKEKSQQNSALLQEEVSLVEKRHPKEWGWLVEFRSKYSSITDTNVDTDTTHLNVNRKSAADGCSQEENVAKSKSQSSQEFFILRRKYESMDDITLSSSESDQEMEDNVEEVADSDPLSAPQKTDSNEAPTTEGATSDTVAAPENNVVDKEASLSPIEELDKETRVLRSTLLDLPSGELSSVQIVIQVTDTLVALLNRYSDLNGTAGINHCGDVIAGNSTCDSTTNNKFPLNEEIVTFLIKSYLTSATGTLRAEALMEAFVLPLVLEMNPVASTYDAKQQKPASRSLASLIVTLARDRPMECVDAILAPSLVPLSAHATEDWEPSRFQCELISRVLRAGRDSLPSQAIALFVEQLLLPTDADSTGVKWSDNTMPLLTTCLNRRPPLSEVVIAKMADEIIDALSPNKCSSMDKSMKFATLLNALVTKYGPQLKTTRKVDPLIEAVSRLKTFMSKTVTASLKKLK